MKLPLFILPLFLTLSLAETLYEEVSASRAKELIILEKPPTILDVRTAQEYEEGHLEGAINISFNNEDFTKQLATLEKTQTYLIHCKSGGRSTKAEAIMRKLGFKFIYHMTSGYDGWLEEQN